MKSALLDSIYDDVKNIILSRQHPVTGLFPASTSVSQHGDYTDAWVRDNVYTIMAAWALSLAYKKKGGPTKQDELEQACVKLMRGLLQCMMRQSDKVERFKVTHRQTDALHAKYNTATGLPVVADDAWGHLQLDATSVYLLLLAQMTAGGLRVICTQGEVDFVQNLIFYIAGAHRTPDFGIWERGNKINNGNTEVNASSVGMAKAAMQALDGLNLFGEQGPQSAVVYVLPDAVARSKSTLQALLPRESRSKEVDAALLSVIGFPAFCMGEDALVELTRKEILSKLGGRYGCKRFLLDGHQSVLEDGSRIHYEHSELINFENIESEWPLFFAYLYIDALHRGDHWETSHYREALKRLMIETDGRSLLPELYYVPEDKISAEKEAPGSQTRVANDNVPLVWAQSLYTVGQLLDEGFLDNKDLDPRNIREIQTYNQPATVALVIVAQNAKVKEKLAENGVISQTVDDIDPIQVMSSEDLASAYTLLGANEALGLTGRACRPVQSLSTALSYCINGQRILCLSGNLQQQKDYRLADARLVSYSLLTEIQHVKKHWFYEEPAVFTLLITENQCDLPGVERFFSTLKGLQHQNESDYISHATADIAYRASRAKTFCLMDFQLSNIFKQRLPECRYDSEWLSGEFVEGPEIDQLHALFNERVDVGEKVKILETLASSVDHDTVWKTSQGIDVTFSEMLKTLYAIAQWRQQWFLVRLCFSLIEKKSSELSEAIAELMVHRLSLVIGAVRGKDHHITRNLPAAEVSRIIETATEDRIERVLIGELLLILSSIIRTEPGYFSGLRRIRIHDVLIMCAAGEEQSMVARLGYLSPYELFKQVRYILKTEHERFTQGVNLSFFARASESQGFFKADNDLDERQGLGVDWFAWRTERGLNTRFDDEFVSAIWSSLKHVKRIIFSELPSDDAEMNCELVLKSMTSGEESFILLLENMTHLLHPAYYKTIVIEALYAYSEYCAEHPDIMFEQPINLPHLINLAAEMHMVEKRYHDSRQEGETQDESEDPSRSLDLLLRASPECAHDYFLRVFSMLAENRLEQVMLRPAS